jgi:hypothetical protein
MTKYKGMGRSDQDIIRAIGYITDMKYIASYYGVDVKRVIHLRDKIKKGTEKKAEEMRPEVEHATTAKPNAYSTGLNSDSERKWNADAKEGSTKLRDALFAFFEKRMLEKAGLEKGQ